jgi:pilus assembly protein CpaB
MKRKAAIVFLVMALALGGVTAWLATTWLKNQSRMAANRNRLQTTTVVVARSYIPQGLRLARGDLQVVRFPKASVPPGAFSSPRKLYGRVLRWSVFRGEPVLASRLAQEGMRGGLSAVIKTTQRAMAVRVNDVIGVSGFVQPGDRVDVLVTFDKRLYRDNPQTRIVVQNVLVLAVGRWVQGGSRSASGRGRKKPQMVRAVTLEVTPEQSERLALAATYGKVVLALRNQGDTIRQETLGISGTALVPPEKTVKPRPPVPVQYTSQLSLLTGLKPLQPQKKAVVKKRPRPARPTVEVIQGDRVSRQPI